MKLTNSAVPVYTVSGSDSARTLPDWLPQKKRRKDSGYANRVELLQDFEFEEASQCVRVSDDGEWVMSTGTYKPQIHTHYLPNLSLSWARHTDTLNKTFLILSSDYSKTAHLQEDRSIEFHTPGGCHHTVRIPRYGRDLAYDKVNAELLVPAVGVNAAGMGEVFRVNLEVGRFMSEFEVDVGGDDMTSSGGGALQGGIRVGAVNTAALAQESHNLYAFGTSLGTVEYWDPRSRIRVATMIVPEDMDGRPEVTALSFHRSGIQHAVGTSSGLIYLYDLRSPTPTLKKDQGYGYPIQHVEYLTPSTSSRLATSDPKILTGDRRILKIWDQYTGEPWTSVEPTVDMNCVAWCQDTGMILTANEGKQQHAFFIPQLGPAPKWCTFLDNVVEEMADDPNDPHSFATRKVGEVYDNYKFLTMAQLRTLNLDHLVGKTNLLRPYMHGYFVAQNLYEEARLVVNPTSWEEERAKRVQQKIENERESRIRGQKKITAKVNRKMVEQVLAREEKNEKRRAQRILAQGGDESTSIPADKNERPNLLQESRFGALFQDEDFAVDETSREFKQINPSTKPTAPSNLDHERGLTAVEQEAVDDVPGSSDDSEDFAGSDGEDPFSQNKTQANGSNRISTADYKRSSSGRRRNKRGDDSMQMRVSSHKNRSSSTQHKSAGSQVQDRSFASRASNLGSRSKARRSGAGSGVYGEKTITFEPSTAKSDNKPKYDARANSKSSGKDRRSASGNTFRNM